MTTEDDVVGWSEFDEGFGSPGVGAAIQRLSARVIGQNVFQHERIRRAAQLRPQELTFTAARD